MKKIETNLNLLTEFIKDFYVKNNYLPSVREMAKYLGIKSTSTINYYLNVLESRNIIKKNSDNKARAFEIIEYTCKNNAEFFANQANVSLLGNITAGSPILAVENYEDTYSFPSSLFGKDDLFMLKVFGESMIDAGILDGDYIVVHKQNTASNGDIVAVMIEDRVTCKRFYKEKDRYRLQPENLSFKPIYCDAVEILGLVVGVIRNQIN